ncbi:hypothetical protein C5167_024466 [Papaver somniferum]|uniref:Complex 1 LYR protein domain-containing protein n=1 Tax=Papaver somniferum TaxID=3469 RepID=A0A4Y7JRP2_PAPSO|nr:hypothetical protein C5167_024466 [Papaver somniferum]
MWSDFFKQNDIPTVILLFSYKLGILNFLVGVLKSFTAVVEPRSLDYGTDQSTHGRTLPLSGGEVGKGLQKQVLGLYRGFLRAARSKGPEDRKKIESYVSSEFRNNAKNVERKNFIYIEYLLRRGTKQLDQLKIVETVSTFTIPSRSSN